MSVTRFTEALVAAEQARKQGGRMCKDKRAEVGEQVKVTGGGVSATIISGQFLMV